MATLNTGQMAGNFKDVAALTGQKITVGSIVRLFDGTEYLTSLVDEGSAIPLADSVFANLIPTAGSINDLSQAYLFDTDALYKISDIVFPVGKTIHLKDRDADFTVVSGTTPGDGIIVSTSVNQSISLVIGMFVTLKSTGALANTDSTAAIQEADNLAFAAGVPVTGVTDTFLLSDGVDLSADWQGGGGGELKIIDNASAGTVATFSAVSVVRAGAEIRKLKVNGNRANQTWLPIGSANYGIAVMADDVVVSSCETYNVTANGHGCPTNADRGIFSGNKSHGNGKKGLHSGDVAEITITNGFYYNNELDSGIGLHQGIERIVVTGNHCFGNGTYGIHCGDTVGSKNLDSLVTSNICHTNTINDIYIEGKGNVEADLQKVLLCSGNEVSSPLGIQMVAVKNVKVTGNILKSSQILGTNCYSSSVSNNDFYSPPSDFAVKFVGGVVSQTTLLVGDHIVVQGNNFFDGTTTELVVMSGHANSKVLDNNNVNVTATYNLRTFTDTANMEIRQSGLSLLEGNAFKDVIDVGQNRTHTSAISPATGAWERGDRAYDDTPSATLFIGWVCVTAGSPGAWKTWGAISA